jgi:hypothetical protein
MYAHLTTRCTSLDASQYYERRHSVDAEIEGVLIASRLGRTAKIGIQDRRRPQSVSLLEDIPLRRTVAIQPSCCNYLISFRRRVE